MIRKLLGIEPQQSSYTPEEGDLFKRIELGGKCFEIRYGFYEECDRHTPLAEPVAIYPDFTKKPEYTNEGQPFVTEMQTLCSCFDGVRDQNSVCGDCIHYKKGDELIGICTCEENKKASSR
ncbi:MAG: hypothetical protein E7315_00200 [Clostridiales bacterium]|nr:hypothetical protein [Clostridiales bacterium]